MIKVSGLSFTPIHDFLPRKAKPYNQRDTRFIALANNTNEDKSSYSKITKQSYEFETNKKIEARKAEAAKKKAEEEAAAAAKKKAEEDANLFNVNLSGGGTRFNT